MARPSGLNYKGKFHVIERDGEYLLVIFRNDYPSQKDIVNRDYYIIRNYGTRSSLYRERKKLESEFGMWKRIFEFLNK